MDDLAQQHKTELSEAAELVLEDVQQPSLAPIWITCAVLLTDLPVLGVSFWFGQYSAVSDQSFSPFSAGMAAVAAALVAVTLMTATASYAPRLLRSPSRSLLRVFGSIALPTGFMCFVWTEDAPAIAVATLASVALSAIPLRLGAASILDWICRMHLLDRRAVVAGGGEHALALIRGLARLPENDIRLVGIFDDRDDLRSPQQVLGVPKLGGYQDLIAFARRSEIDLVIVALPLESERRISWLLESFRVLPVEVRLSAFSSNYVFAKPEANPLIAAIRHNFSPGCRLAKRLFDILFASIALAVAAPAMAVAAAAIRLDSPGPILFRQRRYGYNDRVIEILKFRSMNHDCADPEARNVVIRGDPRVTRVGRFIRKTSIDELPQLFNVLRGGLSLVGPRPHAIDAVSSRQERFARIVDGYSARHRLPPGITGWAQIHGWRGEIDEPAKLKARFEHDLYYVENWSIWLDLRILLRTPLSLLDSRFAY